MGLFGRMTTSRPANVIARGLALFFGMFSVVNTAVAVTAHRSENVWWLDMSALPGPLSWLFGVFAAWMLVEFGLRPRMGPVRRILVALVSGVLCATAVVNSTAFYRGVASGEIVSGIGWPFSLVLAVVFGWMVLVVWLGVPEGDSRRDRIGVIAVTVIAALLFPLAQVAFFGTTDYRRPAAAIVVLGARVRDDGSLSGSLADRVLTAVELYQQGLAPLIIMSGGTGQNGIDESQAMKDFAVARGVPASAIEVDPGGVDTDSTVRNTDDMVPGGLRVLVVSQFYHLPRIKLAYRAVGRNVYTVPARETLPIPKTPIFVLREVPGFWVYWGRAVVRDLTAV